MSVDPVETFVFLPFSKYKSLDVRAKKAEFHDNETQTLKENQSMEEKGQTSADPSLSTSNFEVKKRRKRGLN